MPNTPYRMIDVVDELRLRRWARENFVEADQRDPAWHVIVHDEMARRDRESEPAAGSDSNGSESPCARIVPLLPDSGWTLHGAHVESSRPPVLFTVPDLEIV